MQTQYRSNLPQKAFTAQQIQTVEGTAAKHSGMSLMTLMRRAGQVVYQQIRLRYPNAGCFVILLGKGNNAGDGFVVARHLLARQYRVYLMSMVPVEEYQGDAKQAYLECLAAGGILSDPDPIVIKQADVIIDAVFGSGFRGVLSEQLQAWFACAADSGAQCVSIDIPSGIDGTSGRVAQGCFHADLTITFIGLKQGTLTGTAKCYVGTLHFDDLGVADAFTALATHSSEYLSHETLLSLRPERALDSYKQQCGHVLLVGGAPGMAGAIRLAAEACLRSGAGLVSVATHPDHVSAVLQGRYELMVHGVGHSSQLTPLLAKADIVVIGPGLGQDPWGQTLWQSMADITQPIVCDADGLNWLSHSSCKSSSKVRARVLTPHWGEAKRLATAMQLPSTLDRFSMASQLAVAYRATVVLKGPGSLIAEAGRININRSGTQAMASAGMGDVLAGLIAGLMAQGMTAFDASCLAVYIHGLAAEKAEQAGGYGLLASDLFKPIRQLLG